MKKIIDISKETKIALSIDAAKKEQNLKEYIEELLDRKAKQLKQ